MQIGKRTILDDEDMGSLERPISLAVGDIVNAVGVRCPELIGTKSV